MTDHRDVVDREEAIAERGLGIPHDRLIFRMGWGAARHALLAEIDRLNAEWMAKCEELRKDAERYQFLKANAFRGEPDMGGNHHWMGIGRKIGRGSTLNEAIDAALAKKEGA